MRYKVTKIWEADYGCEGIPEGKKPEVQVFFEADDGQTVCRRIEDDYLYTAQIQVGDCVELTENTLPRKVEK